MKKTFTLPAFMALLMGCTSSVTIESHSLTQIESRELAQYIGVYRARQEVPNSLEGFLLVRLRTTEDLIGMARQNLLIFEPKVWYCEQLSKDFRLNVPGISQSGKSLFEWSHPDNLDISYGSDLEYDVLLYASLKEDALEKQLMPDTSHAEYDLSIDAGDICLAIGGGTYGNRVRSNTIRITEESIRKVLSE